MNRLVALALGLLTLGGVTSAVVLSALASEPDSAFTTEGGGAEAFVLDSRTLGLTTQRLLSGPAGMDLDGSKQSTLLVIVDPQRAYGLADVEAVENFLSAGGRLLVVNSFGQASSLTAPWGVSFSRVRLVDPDLAAGLNHSIDGRQVAFHPVQPSTLQLGPQLRAEVVVQSSGTSFLDRDGNGLIDDSDPRGPFPVLVEAAIGDAGGRLVAVADLSLLAPPAGADANGPWRRAILTHLLPEGGRVLIDESHPKSADPLLASIASALAAARTQTGTVVLGSLAALMLVAAALPLPRDRWGLHRFNPNRFIRRGLVGPSQSALDFGPQGPRWTRRGAFAVAGAPALALLAILLGDRNLAWLAVFLGLGVCMSLLAGPPRLSAVRQLSSHELAEGATLTVNLQLSVPSMANSVEVFDRIPSEFALEQGQNWFRTRLGRSGLRISYQAVPSLRGPYAIGPLFARRIDALHLHVRDVVCETPDHVRVAPRREPLNRMPFKARLPSVTLGPHFVNRAGEGSEFHSLREYHDGDSFRSINWRASARSRQLVVSQRVHESRTVVTLFLDAREVAGAGPAAATPLAQGCRAAFSLAAGALQVRDRIRFLSYGDGVQELPVAPASQQLHELRRMLSSLPAAGATPFRAALDAVLPSLKSGHPVVLISGLEGDDTILEGMRTLRGRGLLPMVLSPPLITQPQDAQAGEFSELEDLGPEPDAPAILERRQATVRALRGAGVTVFETVPGIPLDNLFRLGVGL